MIRRLSLSSSPLSFSASGVSTIGGIYLQARNSADWQFTGGQEVEDL